MPRGEMREILELVARGELSSQAAEERLAAGDVIDLGFARLDATRAGRQGVPEAVLAERQDPRAGRRDRRVAARAGRRDDHRHARSARSRRASRRMPRRG